jgi:hypothetical protein
LKLSHHPDGFVQFSGEGIISGKDENGRIRGIGLYSWPLVQPTLGPSFSLVFSDPTKTGRPTKNRPGTIVLQEDDIAHMRMGLKGVQIIGFYLPVRWREFVHRVVADHYEIGVVNPGAQAVLRLRVLMASKDSRIPGMVGLQVTPHGLDFPNDEPAFIMVSSTGNLRRNRKGELLGDELVCIYPPPASGLPASLRSLNRPLNAPPYVLPPWYSRAAANLARWWRRRGLRR